jgi:hypothetical protein
MKIQTRLVLLMILSAVTYAVLFASFMFSNIQSSRYTDLLRKGDNLISELYYVSVLSRDLLLAPDLDEAYESWLLGFEEFDNQYTDFLRECEALGIVRNEEFRMLYNDASNIQIITLSTKDEIQKALLPMVEDDIFYPGLIQASRIYKEYRFQSAASIEEINANIKSISLQMESFVQLEQKVNSSIFGMNSGIGELSTQIREQTHDISEVSSGVEEIHATVKQVGLNISENGQKAVEMERLAENSKSQLETTTSLVVENAQDMEEIHKILKIINNIASQTNLLSMNAATKSSDAFEQMKSEVHQFSSIMVQTGQSMEEFSAAAQSILHAVLEIDSSSHQIDSSS